LRERLSLCYYMLMDKNILIYVAGFFDGDGSVGIYSRRGKQFHLRTQVTQNSFKESDALFVDLKKEFGGNVTTQITLSGKSKLNWQLNSDSATNFLKAIEPFLRLKKEQARFAIKWQKERPKPFRNAKGQIESKAKDRVAIDKAAVKAMKAMKNKGRG